MARRGDNIHKRKDGRWEGRYKVGFHSDGSSRYRSVYAYSYADCKKKLMKILSSSSDTPYIPPTQKIFSNLLARWLSSNRIRLKGATEAKYINIIESHILPELGGVSLSALNSDRINSFLENKLKFGSIKNGMALSPSYVRTMAVIIEAAINHGVMEGMCSPLKTPIHKPSVSKKELLILNQAAEAALTKILINDSSKVALGALIALQAGLRIGEVCALRWCDVDFEGNIIHIRHTISRVLSPNKAQKTTLVLDTPKTPSSQRDVPIPSTLKNALQRVYRGRTSEFVVSDSHTFVGTRTFDHQYRQLLKKYGFRIFNFHALRHTYATRCAEHGMDAKTLSCLLGHASSNTSLNIYVHPSLDMAMQCVEQIYCAV